MISTEQRNIIIETLKPYNPKKIGIFGSFARNENNESSDIDVLYEFNTTIRLFSLIALKEELEKKLNKKVDLVSEKYLNPKLKSKILNELNLIYGQ
ncbi:nucleotidyltransferase family protein [Flavobacterium difficile]|uniref:Nucleotidyltransferase family protein n=1 Tax=Flavobacterium difficile TaxID=2709659 RepID=A0ABX0I2Z3_9FLAO|nr:nucleotidyltransferase family protein [Flavobacterium difficile]NHM00508.1 nucleotidyltransferase family protein [Flavobacterium difficile]